MTIEVLVIAKWKRIGFSLCRRSIETLSSIRPVFYLHFCLFPPFKLIIILFEKLFRTLSATLKILFPLSCPPLPRTEAFRTISTEAGT